MLSPLKFEIKLSIIKIFFIKRKEWFFNIFFPLEHRSWRRSMYDSSVSCTSKYDPSSSRRKVSRTKPNHSDRARGLSHRRILYQTWPTWRRLAGSPAITWASYLIPIPFILLPLLLLSFNYTKFFSWQQL